MAEKYIFDVVLRGGGIKGVAFVGAFEALLERGHQVRRLIGTSAGAIFATFLAAGYDPKKMREVIVPQEEKAESIFPKFMATPTKNAPPENANKFSWGLWYNTPGVLSALEFAWNQVWEGIEIDIGFGFRKRKIIDGLSQFIEDEERRKSIAATVINSFAPAASLLLAGALFDGGTFYDWVGQRLKEIDGLTEDVKFAHFHSVINDKRRKAGLPEHQLSIIASDTDGRRILVLNDKTTPNLPVRDAVRMSMSVPFIWPEVIWDEKRFGQYNGTPLNSKRAEGHRIVDGGLLSNFPLRFFLDPEASKDGGLLGIPKTPVQPPLLKHLGLFLDSTKAVPNRQNREPDRPSAIERTMLYDTASRLLDTMLDASDNEAIIANEPSICRIGTEGFDALNFSLSKTDLGQLIESGRCAMSDYLDKLNRKGK